MTEARECGAFVSWWDGEYEGNCCLPDGHDGPHYDGVSWFNEDREEVNPPELPDRRRSPA